MVLSVRLNAISSVIASTCFICFEDFVGKSFLFTKSRRTAESNKQNFVQSSQQKDQKLKSAFKNIEEKENGSFYKEQKEIQKEYKDELSSKFQRVKQQLQDKKQALKSMKEDGNGSYVEGLKKMYKKYKYQKENESQKALSNQVAAQTQNLTFVNSLTKRKQILLNKIRDFSTFFTQNPTAHGQRLIKKHLFFGVLTACGCIFMPRAYVLLNVTYFGLYQVYFFQGLLEEKKQYPFLQDMKFEPIWRGYVAGALALFGIGAVKLFK